MIIVKLMGGMGNQMFQYATGRALAERHKTTLKLDLTFLLDRTPKKNFIFRKYDLDIFNIKEDFATIADIKKFEKEPNKNKYINYIRKRFMNRYEIIREAHFHFDRNILLAPKNCYLIGYWQSYKYFEDIEEIIRQEFTFNFKLNTISKKMADRINSSNAVCLNIRRTDYVTNPKNINFFESCDLDYFYECIEYISEKVYKPHFFIFTDDIEWCRENLNIKFPFTIVTHKYAGERFEFYLKLMTMCRHYIIPNSTFGWWAAWLNQIKEKIVIAPKRWFKDPNKDTKDLIPSDWIRL